eukprot:CAMPEP_0179417826 /NCGR_PEP_ID=MMETSP0799-20121207/7586_1 /TAXON_ID=46947 /ORGANISM="Geminigera cryophila, Strain CCMP2564" /LENGTH=153 /DNA_ID=CAMNT_0021190885 /DNA_START=28 /DNA_END=487 /DNA_ORIENTATION=-
MDQRVAGSKGAAAADELRLQIEVGIVIKGESGAAKTIGGDPERLAAPYLKKISNLWRGSLISEEEMERIRRERNTNKTDDQRAQDLYWSMYHDRLAVTAATAFSEVSSEVKRENGGKIDAWDREKRGKPKDEPVSALQLQAQLESITAALSLS